VYGGIPPKKRNSAGLCQRRLTAARENIPEDYDKGLTREEIIQFDNEIRPIDITNCDIFQNQNNDILSFMNCIYSTPSRTSIAPISYPNFFAGFSNFETEVNDIPIFIR